MVASLEDHLEQIQLAAVLLLVLIQVQARIQSQLGVLLLPWALDLREAHLAP